jgi:hypothetical protein
MRIDIVLLNSGLNKKPCFVTFEHADSMLSA